LLVHSYRSWSVPGSTSTPGEHPGVQDRLRQPTG